jgi:flagellar biosynthesis protein FliR
MNTFFAALTIALVVGLVLLAVWAFAIAPFVVPNRRR